MTHKKTAARLSIAAFLAIQIAAAQSAGTFVPAGTMNVTRSGHTATVLADGRVLLAGGHGAPPSDRTAEIYDPADGSFTPTGDLTTYRAAHGAALLPDGRVLIFGGFNANSAELYDPSSGTFSLSGSTANVNTSLISAATVIRDGKLVIVGLTRDASDYYGPGVVIAEIYDPSTKAFTTTGFGLKSWWIKTATLADGRILISGDPGNQIYDPATGAFFTTGASSHYLNDSTATPLAHGQVLFAGGDDGDDFPTVFDNAELFDPQSGTFTGTGSLKQPTSGQTATLLASGRVLIAGGGGGYWNTHSSAEVYDPASGAFSSSDREIEVHQGHTATLLPDGRVLIAGGVDSSSAQLYIPSPSAASAASLTAPLAPESLASIFGAQLTVGTASAGPQSAPTSLGGINIRVRDSAGAERLAPLLYVSPAQINFEVPAGVLPGSVTLDILNGAGASSVAAQVRAVAPGIFALPGNIAAAYATRIEPDGSQTTLAPGAPIELGQRPVYLSLFGTGIRGGSSLNGVKIAIGGLDAPVSYAGPQLGIPGLDQVNVLAPAALKGAGFVPVLLNVDGVTANKVFVEFK